MQADSAGRVLKWTEHKDIWASVKTSDVWFIMSPVMRCQNPVKRWEISKAFKSDTLLFPSFSQFWSQTRKPRIPDEEFQSDTPWSPKPRKLKKRREVSNVGWSQELTEVLTATHIRILQHLYVTYVILFRFLFLFFFVFCACSLIFNFPFWKTCGLVSFTTCPSYQLGLTRTSHAGCTSCCTSSSCEGLPPEARTGQSLSILVNTHFDCFGRSTQAFIPLKY